MRVEREESKIGTFAEDVLTVFPCDVGTMCQNYTHLHAYVSHKQAETLSGMIAERVCEGRDLTHSPDDDMGVEDFSCWGLTMPCKQW